MALQPPPMIADGDSTPRTMDSKSRLIAVRVGGRLDALVGRRIVQLLGFLGNNIGVLDLYSR